MRGSVFYTLAIAFCLGIFGRSLFNIDNAYAYALLVLAGALFVWCRRMGSRTFLLALTFLSIALGILRYDVATWDDRVGVFDMVVGDAVTLEGVVSREPDARANTTHLYVEVTELDGRAVDELVLVYASRFPEFEYGDRIRAVGELGRPEVFATDLGRTFDYPGYLSARGVTYTLAFADVEQIGEGEGVVALGALLSLKHAFMDRLEAVLPEPQAGLAEGLVLGVKRALGEDLEDAFRATGIIHIVVLSGYNVTIVAEAIMRLLAYFCGPRTRTIFGIVAIAAFALIAGLSATVLRASLMACLILAARATGRIYDVTRGLVVAGIVMLIANPKLLVFDPGFQLSFVATLGLILLAPLIEAKLALVPTRFQVREFVTATVATQIFVLPLLLYSIGELSLVAVLVNALVLPVVPPAMLLIFLAGAMGLASAALALPFAFLAHLLLSYMIWIVEWFAALPFASVPVSSFPFWVVVVSYALLALFMYRAYAGTENTLGASAPRV